MGTTTAIETGPIRSRLAALAVLVFVGGAFVLVSMRLAEPYETAGRWMPTAAQTSLAQRVALTEANSMNPDPTATASTDQWPANVTSVNFTETTSTSASALTGTSGAPDDRDVLVIQMKGSFESTSFSALGGADPAITHTVVTLVVDATSGDVIDFTATDSAPKLPNSVPLRL